MSPKIGQQDEFEGLYIEKFRSQARPFGEFVKYERDRAALDVGLHLTTKTNSKFRSVSNTRVWFQLKGIQETTLSLAEHDKGSEIALDLPIDDLRFWYASPEAVYLVVYIEAADHFLGEDIMDVIDRQWGEGIFNASTFKDGQKYARVRLSRKAILDDALCEFDSVGRQSLMTLCGNECFLTVLCELTVRRFVDARWATVSIPCVAYQRNSNLRYSINSSIVF
jgi:hypothetical protein